MTDYDYNSKGAKFWRLVLRVLGGWKFVTPPPTVDRAVVLAVPHTSNIDGFLLVFMTRSIGMKVRWMVKDTWTKPPIGWLTKPVGAVPVNRKKATGMVEQMATQFAESDDFHLVIPPEGTRGAAQAWKSGFYRIARAADVPVVPAYLDYSTKTAGFHAPIMLTGDESADMDVLREIYADSAGMAKDPSKVGPIRLRSEIEPESATD